MDETTEYSGVSHVEPPEGERPEGPRRGFMVQALAAGTGFVAGVVPAVVGMFAAADPLHKKYEKAASAGSGPEFLRVATMSSVPADGKPRLFRVISDKTDAWNKLLDVPIGAVYLIRNEAAPDKVIALNTVCPHLGCFVNTMDDNTFVCPCHDSEFERTGDVKPVNRKGNSTVSPRGLDPLDTKVEGDVIKVQFQNFLTGKVERVPVL